MTASSLVDYKCDLVIDNCLAGVAILLEPHILPSRFVITLVLHDVSFQAVNQGITGTKHCSRFEEDGIIPPTSCLGHQRIPGVLVTGQ